MQCTLFSLSQQSMHKTDQRLDRYAALRNLCFDGATINRCVCDLLTSPFSFNEHLWSGFLGSELPSRRRREKCGDPVASVMFGSIPVLPFMYHLFYSTYHIKQNSCMLCVAFCGGHLPSHIARDSEGSKDLKCKADGQAQTRMGTKMR